MNNSGAPMRLATIAKLSLAATVVLSVLAGVMIWREQINISTERAALTQAASFKQLGLDLAGASDYLTEQIRYYTVTGDKTYLDKYWREVKETRTRDRVVKQLQDLGATPGELGLVDQAKASSDALIKLEEKAMQAVSYGRLDEARGYVYGADYANGKAKISALVKNFQDNMNIRAMAKVAAARSAASTLMTLVDIILLLTAASFISILYFIFQRRTVNPLLEMQGVVTYLAGAKYDIEVPHHDRTDEIGDMARAVVVFKENGIANEQMQAERHQAQAERDKRQQEVDRLIRNFETLTSELVDSLSSSSTELEASAGTLTSTAESTGQASITVANTSQEVSDNVQSTAAATEEITLSVNEISRQVQEASRVAQTAVTQARKTDNSIQNLSQAATRIGDIVKLITAVAEQTNLLALNATIEAARAGEAGRGFAVVASEVKALASQTAKATDEIGAQIIDMQAATENSVTTIQEINTTINLMSEISSTIAAAVEQQGAATQEIARNIQQVARLSGDVAHNIGDVSRGAGETGAASEQVLSTARLLSSDSARLKSEVEKFLSDVRAA
ncbi:MAG TPA: methyl-accepting chemotaxis protein [Parvibaculum sp.]